MNRVVYMDYHATTPVDPRVLEVMLPYFTEKFGNAASRNHAYGWAAEEAVETAREQVARAIGARSKDIVFTSGATESNNLALKGVIEFDPRRNHIVTVSTEHKSVLDVCKALEKSGRATVTYLKPDCFGRLDPDLILDALRSETAVVSVMMANNEIGTVQPIAEIGRRLQGRGVLLHCDATQALGKLPIDVQRMGIDLLSLSAHKIYGPKGCGALYARSSVPRVRLQAQIHGGGHERGIRSGTLNVPGIVGLGKACEIALAEMDTEQRQVRTLRDRLQKMLLAEIDEITVNGHPSERLPGNLNVTFAYVEGESLLMALRDIAVSSGSACTSATLEPSHVLRAIGLSDEQAHSSIRFGLGRFNTEEDVDYVASRVVQEVRRLRARSPFYRRGTERGAWNAAHQDVDRTTD